MTKWLLACAVLVLLGGCDDPVEENVTGQLGRVTIVFADDGGCSPARLSGDAGLQFYGVRPDGGIVFTLPQNAVFGPLIDGGALESVQRQSVPAPGDGKSNVGATPDGTVDDDCEGIFTRWVPVDGGLSNAQEWPGLDKCETGPLWLPNRACVTTRTFLFEPVSACELKCVKVSAAQEVSCDC